MKLSILAALIVIVLIMVKVTSCNAYIAVCTTAVSILSYYYFKNIK